MKKSIGLTVTLNIVIIFIAVAFAFIAGTLSYTKAFKAGSIIVNALEKYEGYNELSRLEIERKLNSIGYLHGDSSKCKKTKTSKDGTGKIQRLTENGNSDDSPNKVYIKESEKHEYCIYYFDEKNYKRHYSYGVITYMTIDLSMFGQKLKMPVYVRSRRSFKFNT